ncbi:hypothetical protein JR316_0002899 [Psilocybe cubensis]|uniref:Uncharacterized protein n=2 Tax=Psilocybe cubensis TaxID=181762 RepID=A0ACB8H7E3_PSICU|nr:hypothetical protein JR316_0002899 [Psilocybe cubensis]KAH9483431.1 hypothetical protein JR316_0002899 [Psilocybe cubensis]
MKLSNPISAVASLLCLIPASLALIATEWTVSNVPGTGLKDITFPLTIAEADHIEGYYFAQQFGFVGQNDVGYTGIQPRPDNGGQSVLHGVFSSFIAGTSTNDPNCTPGADGGPGVSCSVEWNGVYGRKYNFEVKTAGSNVWVGTAIDTVTRQRIRIGSYTLPAGTQGITGSQVGFVEWYPWNGYEPPNHCQRLPYQRTIFGNPTTTHSGSIGTQGLAYEYGDCVGDVAFNTSTVVGGISNNCGFRGQTGY